MMRRDGSCMMPHMLLVTQKASVLVLAAVGTPLDSLLPTQSHMLVLKLHSCTES